MLNSVQVIKSSYLTALVILIIHQTRNLRNSPILLKVIVKLIFHSQNSPVCSSQRLTEHTKETYEIKIFKSCVSQRSCFFAIFVKRWLSHICVKPDTNYPIEPKGLVLQNSKIVDYWFERPLLPQAVGARFSGAAKAPIVVVVPERTIESGY